jgi:hypothetical protein
MIDRTQLIFGLTLCLVLSDTASANKIRATMTAVRGGGAVVKSAGGAPARTSLRFSGASSRASGVTGSSITSSSPAAGGGSFATSSVRASQSGRVTTAPTMTATMGSGRSITGTAWRAPAGSAKGSLTVRKPSARAVRRDASYGSSKVLYTDPVPGRGRPLTTAKAGQRHWDQMSREERILGRRVKRNPSGNAKPLPHLNADKVWPARASAPGKAYWTESGHWQKMERTVKSPRGSVTYHYQLNLKTGKVEDLKVVNSTLR